MFSHQGKGNPFLLNNSKKSFKKLSEFYAQRLELSGADLDEHEKSLAHSWRLPLERIVMREQGILAQRRPWKGCGAPASLPNERTYQHTFFNI